jgi:hypothetical protein
MDQQMLMQPVEAAELTAVNGGNAVVVDPLLDKLRIPAPKIILH